MGQEISTNSLNKDFESIKKVDKNGVEYWHARELMSILGYPKWEKAEEVIGRAAAACMNSGEDVDNHFHQTVKMVPIGSEAVRKVGDWKLDRYACYLVAQNGDSSKPEVAQAQTYFAVQTRRQEVFKQLSQDNKRLFIRNEITAENKKLFSTAKQAGVKRFGSFNDAGYQGLYGMPLADIEKHKGLKKGELLDRAGTTELAARTHFMVGGKVRQTIKDIGGTPPENLSTEPHIRKLKNKKKLL